MTLYFIVLRALPRVTVLLSCKVLQEYNESLNCVATLLQSVSCLWQGYTKYIDVSEHRFTPAS
jgi:hypothetical protein